jgi:hypothetical protein
MNILHLGEISLVLTHTAQIVGFNIGTGWYALDGANLDDLEAFLQPPLGIRDVVSLTDLLCALA